MGESLGKGEWSKGGGIVSLVELIEENHEALDYDLLTLTHYNLDDVGGKLSWRAFYSFVKNLNPESALVRKLYPENSEWATRTKTNAILADLYDILAVINANILMSSGTRAKAVKYPRPNQEDKGLPREELHQWIKKKWGGE